MLLPGRCHCGNISFSLAVLPDPTELRASACTCSFCSKHGAVWTAHPAGVLKVEVEASALVARYSFATKTAQFHACSCCGVVPLVTSRIESRLYAVVSVNALEGVDRSLFRHQPVSFDGESEAARLARRRQHWIADVEYIEGGGATNG